MSAKTLVTTYVRDVRVHARSHPWALLQPRIVRGYFPHQTRGKYQKLFFELLRKKEGFRRTRWQLVLPGQTAGLVKRVPKHADGTDQLHVRFYANGTVDCEVEHHNFHLKHWSGARYSSITTLHDILQKHAKELGKATTTELGKLFVLKAPYAPVVKKRRALV